MTLPAKKIKILFFTPYAGRTGSEMMLFNILKNIDKELFDIRLFALQNGELLPELSKIIKVYYDTSYSSIPNRIASKVRTKGGLRSKLERSVLKLHREFKPDLWYLNTMVMANVADIAIRNKIKFAVHFHELLSQYSSISYNALENMLSKASFAVGCSQKVSLSLKTMGCEKVFVQYECVDFSAIKIPEKKDELKKKYNIPGEHHLFVMSGQRIERKGFDIFIETAQRFQNKNCHFLWLGTSKNTGYDLYLNRFIKANKIDNLTILSPDNRSYYALLDLADFFFLASREDPFPLVMIEAAYLGKPLLAFHSGGSSEFINSNMGVLIDDFTPDSIDQGLNKIINSSGKGVWDSGKITEHAKIYGAKVQTRLFEKLISKILTGE